MTEPAVLDTTADIEGSADTAAVIALLAIGEEFGEIAMTIAAAFEAADATPSVRAAADQLRHAATTLRERVVRFRDDMQTA